MSHPAPAGLPAAAEMRPPVPLHRAILLSCLTGVLLGTSQIELSLLAWVALAPLTLAAAGRTLRAGAVLGFVSGMLAGSAIYGVFSYGWLLYTMLIVYCGVHMAMFGALIARSFGRVHPALDLVLPALGWTACEYLRRIGTASFPINMSATQTDLLPLLQLARWTGGHGVSFLIALPAGLLAGWAWRGGRLPWRQAATVAALLLLTCGYGEWRLHTADVSGVPVRVAGVQTAFQNWLYNLEPVSPEHREMLRSSVFSLTEQAAQQGAELIVWPETALHDRVLEDPELKERIAAIARRHRASILAGFFRENELGLEHNSAVLFTPDGRIASYDKRRPAGLAEWRITPGAPDQPPLSSPSGRLGVMICLESVYPQDARRWTQAGAELLLVTTNDAGFLFSPIAGFHGQRSVLAAIESDRYLLHLSQAGPSLLLDPLGRAVTSTGMFHQQLVRGTMFRRQGLSPYHRFGDWFAWATLGGALLAAVAPAGVSRRRRHTVQDEQEPAS